MRRAARRPAAAAGRTKQRGDAVNDTGLRFNDKAPVIDITVTPPEIEGLSEDDYDVVAQRVHCRLATIECRHVVIRYHYVKVKIRETGALLCAPAREGVFKNSCADVSFVAALLIDKFLWPLHRQHRMLAAAGIAVNRGSPVGQPGDRASRSTTRSGVRCCKAPSFRWTRRRSGPDGIRASPAA